MLNPIGSDEPFVFYVRLSVKTQVIQQHVDCVLSTPPILWPRLLVRASCPQPTTSHAYLQQPHHSIPLLSLSLYVSIYLSL
jgi:hypothetical protein